VLLLVLLLLLLLLLQSSLMGPSLTIPIAKGRFALGTWQGIYLNEHRCGLSTLLCCTTLQCTQ
jgi:hypothetical protein